MGLHKTRGVGAPKERSVKMLSVTFIGEDEVEPKYSNVQRISHGFLDFRIDFALVSPTNPNKPRVVATILLSPEGAKRFLKALMENIQEYEKRFGEIPLEGKGG